MEEKTIFPGNQADSGFPAAPSEQAPQAIEPQAPMFKPAPPAGEEEEESFFSAGKIVKAIVGIIFIALVIFVAIKFVLPRITTQEKKETVTLAYWGLWEDANVMKSIIADFERDNPNIKISYTSQDIKQYKERLATRIQNDTGPDIFRFHNTWVIQLKDYLLPIDSQTVSKDEFQKAYYPVVEEDLVRNGAIYGIPLGIDTLSLFTNTEALNAAGAQIPMTWEEFGRVARLLTVKDELGKIQTAGAAMGTFDNINHAPDIVSLLLLQNGADLSNLPETSKNALDALEYYASFANGEGSVWDETLEPSMIAFANGSLGMYFGYSWDIFAIKAVNPNLSFSVSPVPGLPGRNITVASYWAEGVSSKSKNQKEALLFLKYLTQKETVQKLYTEASKTRLFGQPYARVDLAQSLSSNELVYPFVSQAKNAKSSFFASDTYDDGLNDQMNGYLGNAVRSVLGNTSAESAIEVLSQGVSQVLSQYEE